MYGDLYQWLVIGENLTETISFLNDTEYSIMTDLIIAIPHQRGYKLYDVYNSCKYRGGILNVTLYGYWDASNGFKTTLFQSRFQRRQNFHGLILRLAAIVSRQIDKILLLFFFF